MLDYEIDSVMFEIASQVKILWRETTPIIMTIQATTYCEVNTKYLLEIYPNQFQVMSQLQ